MIERGKHDFRKILLEAVDRGLSFLGEGGRLAMYYQTEKRFQVSREEIPQKLEAFQKALEGLFGFGASVIEILIVKRLYEGLGLSFEEHNGWTLKEYVRYARDVIESYKS